MNKQYYVYIITNIINSVLYTGMTGELTIRIAKHKNGIIPGFSKRYNLCKLVYFEDTPDAISAITREKQIKKMYRQQKIDLINNFNPKWHDLYTDL